jgi:hypothetical protein
MASISLGIVGAAIGGFAGGGFNPAGARLGFSIGVAVGGVVDSARQTKRQDVGRLSDVGFSGSTYGAMIPQCWGRYGRIACNIIWGGDLTESSKDKGSKLSGAQTRQFSYTTTFAALVCKGPATIRRIWAEDILIYDNSSGLGAASEVQQISVGSNSAGAFTISFGGNQTVSIAYNAAAATVQSALEALPAIGAGQILVTGAAGGPWTATFTGTLGAQNVARMDMHDDTLSGGSGQGIHTIQQGGQQYDITIYDGTATQAQDPTMVAVLGAANTPAYRNRAYFVLKNFPLALWSNRIPNLLCEVEHVLSYPELILADGATVYYRFEDSPGILVDSGPAAYTLTNSGPGALTQVTGEYGEAASFGATGVTLERTVGVVAGLMPASFSIEAWFQYKGGSPSAGTANRFRYRDPTNTAIAWELICQPDQINPLLVVQFHHETAALSETPITYSFTRDTAWHHVVVTCVQGGAVILYVDGVQAATGTATFSTVGALVNSSARLQVIGSDNTHWDECSFVPALFSAQTVAYHYQPGIQLRHLLADLFAQEGLDSGQYSLTAATDWVDGFALTSRMAVRDLADLLAYYNTLLVEIDGQIKAVKRGGASVLSISEGDLAARLFQPDESDVPPKVTARRLQELELPFRIDVAYLSGNKDYEIASQGALRYTKPHVRDPVTVNTGLALRDDPSGTAETKARQVAERLLYQTWTEREPFEFSLPPRYLLLAPADVITLPHAGNTFRVRIQQMDVALPGPLSFTAVLDDAGTLVQEVPGGAVVPSVDDTTEVTDTLLVAWSGNALVNADADSVGLYAVANGNGAGFWGGAALYWSRDDGESFQSLETITAPATIGITSSVLAAGTETAVWDDVATVDVTIQAGDAPVSTSDAAVMAGDNSFLVGDEVLQAGTVTALGGASYRLSHLLRGARGTGAHWPEHLSGERFAILTPGTVLRVDLGMDLRGKSVVLKAVANGQAIDDAEEQEIFIAGDELRVYNPVDAVGSRDGSNNLTITWVRRTRVAEGLQDAQDEPLGEDLESYSVFVRAGTTKTITAVSSATAAVISSASHGYSASDTVLLVGIKGMPALEGVVTVISSVTTNTFTVPIDTSGMPAYVSGGTAEKILRTISVTAQTAAYSAANQTSDGLTPGNPVSVAIAQIGHFGAGFVLLATV